MPTIMLRGLPADLVARVKAYAARKKLTLPAAGAYLLADGLARDEARQAAGRATAAGMTPAERSERAKMGARARWER